MVEMAEPLRRTLREYQQEHLLHGWESLDGDARAALAAQLQGVDFARLRTLFSSKDEPVAALTPERVRPIPVESIASTDADVSALGEAALRRGEVAVILVAGGQGSRLGFEKPKGMFPIGPVSGKTLFQIHAEKVLALQRAYSTTLPLLLMTSPATHDETVEYFTRNRFFGLDAAHVHFFQQGTLPALDLQTGKLLLERPGVLFTSPNGHGGTLSALADSGLLRHLQTGGVRHLFYFQVDNPLVQICDPRFLGRHLRAKSQASSKAIAKAFPEEKMGVFALLDGRCSIIEYSDMPKELMLARGGDGRLLHGAGSPAIHLFDLEFLAGLLKQGAGLPFHLARKKVPFLDPATGQQVTPRAENALKFEMFIFDALPRAERWLVIDSPRAEEFAPVKNAEGVDSPRTCQQALCNLHGGWLERVGVKIPRDAEGNVAVPVEISPLFAWSESALAAQRQAGRIATDAPVQSPMYLG